MSKLSKLLLLGLLAPNVAALAQSSDAEKKESESPKPDAEAKAAAETITVQGTRAGQKPRVGIFGDQSILDTPFTISSYSRETIDRQQSVTVNQVLRNDPAVTNVTPAGGFTAHTIGFRGFPAGPDAVTFNGIGPGAMFSGALGQLYSIDHIDTVKGPSAALGAFSPSASVGGSVNIVPKAPKAEPLTAIMVGNREKSIISGAVDLSRRFGAGKDLGLRLNLANENGESFQGGHDKRNVAALALSYNISDSMRVNFGYDAVNVRNEGYQNGFVLGANAPVPKAPNPSQNHFQKWSYLVQEWNYGYGSFQWDIAKNWNFTIDTLYGERRGTILSTGTGLIINKAGDMILRPSRQGRGTNYEPFFGGNAYLKTSQDTGSIHHDVTLAFLGNGYDYKMSVGQPMTAINSNLYAPVYVDRPALLATKNGRLSRSDSRSYALSDSIQFLPEWNLLLAAKNTTLHFENYDVASGTKVLNQSDTVTSPVAALTYKPFTALTTYVSYVEGLERGGTAPATAANAGEIMPSIISRQVEVGAKTKLDQDLLVTTALFQIERDLEYLDAASNVYGQSGLQRNQGIELSVNGHASRDLSLTGGIMMLDPRVVKAGAIQHKAPAGVPKLTLPLLADYRIGAGFSANLGLYHFSRQFVDAANTKSLDPWTRIDAGLQYELPLTQSRTSLSVNVENIGDHRYWASAAQGQLALGSPEIWRFALRSEL
ncbi:MAG: TonB-dependent receptor plug domain-containing protein [Oligoflexus sp.]|nr:TonB-dependent receptor plug domain-containing protein [Oligoflexus sp.]